MSEYRLGQQWHKQAWRGKWLVGGPKEDGFLVFDEAQADYLVALQRFANEAGGYIHRPPEYDVMGANANFPEGTGRLWLNNEYPIVLPLTAILALWPDAVESDESKAGEL